MNNFDRIYELIGILHGCRYAIGVKDLAARLECSVPTVKRYLGKLRNEFGLPVVYNPKYQGYILQKNSDENFELPGLWFNVSELCSLIIIHELIDKLSPGLLKAELQPFRQRIEKLLSARGVQAGDLVRRFQFSDVHIRVCCPVVFRLVASAAIERQRLKLKYHSRGKNVITGRTISPQRLIYYRGNWYLAAYCHTRKGLRTLSLDRMGDVIPQNEPCVEIEDDRIQSHFSTSFGIFAGEPRDEAVIRFSPKSARWVAEERWHPQQYGRWLEDGGFELRLPYADMQELMMEILRYGPDVEVISPFELQKAVKERLQQALLQYEKIEK